MPYPALFMLLFLPVLACIALHPLDDIGMNAPLSGKDVEKLKLQEVVRFPPIVETEERVICTSEAKGGSQNCEDATTMKMEELKANSRMSGTERKILGNAIESLAPEAMITLEDIKIQDRPLKSIRRSMLKSALDDGNERTDLTVKDQTVVEDVEEVMDYAQPHRKPPIHNHKP